MIDILRTLKRLSFLAFFLAVGLTACDRNKTEVAFFSGQTMGTTYSVKMVPGRNQVDRDEVSNTISETLSRINHRMSTYMEDSEITVINSSDTHVWLGVSLEFCNLLNTAGTISQRSEGAFDVTVGPLVNLWGFGPQDTKVLPTENELASVMSSVGYQFLETDCSKAQLKKLAPAYIDFSAIAKGYATQILADALMNDNILGLMVEIGGELTVRGKNPDGNHWRIAVETPSVSQGHVAQILSLSDVSVATSGDYRNFYALDGKKVSHTIDPTTGRPIIHNLASVTVVHAKGGEADAWATALNVVGELKGYKLATQENLAAYFIVREESQFSVKYTPEFKKYMVTP